MYFDFKTLASRTACQTPKLKRSVIFYINIGYTRLLLANQIADYFRANDKAILLYITYFYRL